MRLIRWAGRFPTAMLLTLTSGLGTLAYAAPPAACGSLTAGFTVANVPNQPGGSNYNANPPQTTLKTGIWYPSYAAASAYGYDDEISGQVALNATIANCGSAVQFPLVIFSHGWSGCGTQSVFLTEELARRGYIVAAPDHADHGCRADGGAKTATIGGTSIPVTVAPSSTMGIDTVTLGPLPAIKGQENIVLSVGPRQSNPVTVVLQ